jgi:hypothetical protein
MILRAQTLKNKTVYFGVEDAPVCINDKQTILCNKQNSPILLSKTIARGVESREFFEFDFVCNRADSKFLGYVVYTDGFYIWNPKDSDNLIPIRSTDNYTFLENIRGYRIEELSRLRSCIRFKGNDRLFRLNRIMYSSRENIYIELKGCSGPVPITSIKMCTGIGVERKELAFGEYLKDGIIELHDFHPMVKLCDGTYRELESEDYE